MQTIINANSDVDAEDHVRTVYLVFCKYRQITELLSKLTFDFSAFICRSGARCRHLMFY